MTGPAYISSEDSALIREVLGGYGGGSALEIGAGNGGTLVWLARRFRVVVGTDTGRPGMDDWKEECDFVLADAGTCFRPRSFDLVAFNPPYLPGAVDGDSKVLGGESLEVPKKFLRQALELVRPGGKVVFLLNQEADLGDFEGISAESGFGVRKVGERKMFYEMLSVYEASASR